MAKSKKELDKDLMFAKIMPALSDNPFSDVNNDNLLIFPLRALQPATLLSSNT